MELKTDILQPAEKFVKDFFKNEMPEKLVFHNLDHTTSVATACQEMAEYYELNEEDAERLMLAAWFHDTGYARKYEGHEDESARICRAYLQGQQYPSEDLAAVVRLIESTKADEKPRNLLEEILHDADILHTGRKRFFRLGELLRLELELAGKEVGSDSQWEDQQLEFIVNTSFLTGYATENYGKRRQKNLLKQQKAAHKGVSPNQKQQRSGRGVQTMYRSVYRNHINLSSIADAKANMMISINTIIMSVIITLAGTGFTFAGQPFLESIRYTVPILVLLLGAMISVVFAVLSARPDVTSKKVSKERIRNKKSSILFFGNFVNTSLKHFIQSLAGFRKNQEQLYDNMSVDIYYLGAVLTKKYKLLRFSYNTFMVSLCLAVATFIGIFLYSNL